ncbi:dUTP diphosphatase, partial [Campylobacter coli]
LGELLSNYFILAIKCGLNLEILYKAYIGKNILNIFRQNNGYKQDTYKKIWNGREDNEVLAEILEQELDFDTIYKKLEEYYKKV